MIKRHFLLLTIFLFSYTFSYCQIKLPRLISSGMVLQRETNNKLWGWASAGEKVSLSFKNKQYNATTDKDGKWTITLPPQQAGGPYEMLFSGSNMVALKNILFGDVWICSGQSNMEITMERVSDKYADVIAKANNPHIRQFEVPDQYDFDKLNEDVKTGEWLEVNAKNIFKFSAVAYFFANDIYTKYKVPIGLINAALGGSPAEAWISQEALKKFPVHYQEAQKFKNKDLIAQIEAQDRAVSNKWYTLLNSTDEGLKNKWRNPTHNDADWQQMTIPGYWADGDLGNVNGAVWFRKEVNVSQVFIGKPARLLLGRIVDADSVFINGVFVGTTSYQYPPRRYSIPANILKEGKNNITVRVISNSGKGGFVLDKPYKLFVGKDSLDLKGTWKYKLGTKMDPLPAQTFIRWKPSGLFNGMTAPLLNYVAKGVLWYQGESNTENPTEYGDLMQTLIKDWRTRWQQPTLPFLLVQLPNFMEPKAIPAESNWATLRQAQFNTLAVPNTRLAVAIDLGEWNDIHPLNKQDVGKRLALQARSLVYGDKNIVSSGPLYKSMRVQGNKVILTFSNVGSGLMASGNKELTYFSVAGQDKKFVWAKAEIKGNQLIVWNDAIPNPVVVRYAWADNPEGANLYNKENLPASPFEATIK